MKKIYTTLVLLFISITSYSQTDGMSYQAVIIDNNPQEIPGVDVPSNGLPNAELNIRFTILGDGETIEYQETHLTETDAFGMINLMIGLGTMTTESPGAFNTIYWTNDKFLKVEINLQDGSGYIPFSYQELTYIPFAKHREIIATSTLDVDGATNLNSSLRVNNESPTLLTGDLAVLGTAFFSNGLFENLTVTENSELNMLTVDGISNFNNRIRLNANLDEDDEDDYEAYPLQVAGNSQGIAVKLNANDPNRSNNYMSFWSNNGVSRGRIEGNNYLEPISRDFVLDLITPPSFGDLIDIGNGEPIPTVFANDYFNNDYAFGAYHYTIDFTFSIFRFGVNLTAAGGACLVGDCDDAIWSFVDLTVDGIQLAEYILYNDMSIGVAFESGSADYAEWLKKYDENEFLSFGDVVGVRGGLISKSFINAENYMVVSQNPLISGAMPQKDEEYMFERIAFMGQVPVKVIGKANKGDYIIPTGNGDGMAIAVSPQNMKINDYQRIIGVAWQASNGDKLFSYINTAVGINNNDMAGMVNQMQQVMNQMQVSIAKLDTDYKPSLFDTTGILINNSNETNTTLDVKAQLAEDTIKNKKRLDVVLKDAKTLFENHEFDFSKFPYLMEAIENPTAENGQKLVKHYEKVLERLQKMKPTKH